MAAAVQMAPQMGGIGPHAIGGQGQYATYQSGGLSVLEDSDDGDHERMDDDMEAYYAQHDYQQHVHQHQMMQSQGMQYHDDDEMDDEDVEDDDMYSETSEESVLPDENIDFGLIYALHTFLATVEGQASVVKGDSLLLLDDANSYWWLVRVLKTEDVGYIPAENVETPYERLARLNKHRNIDIAAPTNEDKAALPDVPPKESKLKSLIGWKRSPQQPETSFDDDDDPETRANRRVVFAPPTFFEHPGVTWSDDEEDEEDDDDDTHIIDGGAAASQQVEDEDVHDQINVDHELGFEVEPDDGVEWAQDAVEAQRNAAQVTVVDTAAPLEVAPTASAAAAAAASPAASMSVFDTSLDVSSDAHGSLASDMAPSTAETAQFGTAVVAGVAGAAAGAAGLAVLGSTANQQSHNISQHPPAPDRSPSPSVSHSALARTNPTPPPHRAPFTPSPITTGSPDYYPNQSFTETTETLASPSAAPASSDLHAPSTSGQVAPSSTAPSTPPRSSSLGRSGSLTSPRSSNLTSPPPPRPPRRATLRYQDAFDIARLNTIVHARAKEMKRTTPIPNRRAPPQMDAVQRVYYGEKAEMDSIHPDIRACFVHVLAKMDTFDREIDDILGSLVPAH
ncbi:protein phosphatase regulator [Vanrija albida]|uniref:Protein phosphatase regulator n=1 Tax=Vanrija albida TaxID=181172 RepID=A0ABR3Q0K4_9TREE